MNRSDPAHAAPGEGDGRAHHHVCAQSRMQRGLADLQILVVLGLISGITMPRERMVLAAATVIALPIIGTALGHIPSIGAKLGAVTANLQLGIAAALASAVAIALYEVAMEGVMGLTADAPTGRKAAAAR